MKRILFIFIIIFTSAFFVMHFGCSATKKTVSGEAADEEQSVQNDYDEIERLLGIYRDETSPTQTKQQTPTPSQSKNNNDLLKLLEVDEGKKESKTAAKNNEEADKKIVPLVKPPEPVKKEIQKNETQIADLQAQLLQKDKEKNADNAVLNTTIPNLYSNQTRVNASPSNGRYATQSYRQAYDNGLSLFHKRQYRSAMSVFDQLLAIDTHNDYADNAQYWIGESYYAMGRYREAILAFEKVFTFRYSNKNDYAQFKIAQCYYMIGDKFRAAQEFQVFLDNYPNSDLVSRANSYLSKL